MLLAGWVLTAGLLVLLAYRDSDSVDADHPAKNRDNRTGSILFLGRVTDPTRT